jgi:hypothetical protein
MKVKLMYIVGRWAYKLLRPYIVEAVGDKLKPQWTNLTLYMFDKLFGYGFVCGDGHCDNYDLQS